jgi:hypothetical protein
MVMHQIQLPEYMLPSVYDGLILQGIVPNPTHHCLDCGAFGWRWGAVNDAYFLCAACGQFAGESLAGEADHVG